MKIAYANSMVIYNIYSYFLSLYDGVNDFLRQLDMCTYLN